MKKCRDCREEKEVAAFIKNKLCKDGIDTLCLVCNRKRVRAWRQAGNRDSAKESRKYYAKNPRACYEKMHRRRLKKRKAIPKWLTSDDKFIIAEIYSLAKLRKTLTGIEWHVDHIIPLAGKAVCGLHTPDNLQVITAHDNHVKSNTYAGY